MEAIALLAGHNQTATTELVHRHQIVPADSGRRGHERDLRLTRRRSMIGAAAKPERVDAKLIDVKVSEILRLIGRDGWYLDRQKGDGSTNYSAYAPDLPGVVATGHEPRRRRHRRGVDRPQARFRKDAS